MLWHKKLFTFSFYYEVISLTFVLDSTAFLLQPQKKKVNSNTNKNKSKQSKIWVHQNSHAF